MGDICNIQENPILLHSERSSPKLFWDLLGDAVRGSEHPLRADEGGSAQVLVLGVDQGHLPAPFASFTVFAAHHSRHATAACSG